MFFLLRMAFWLGLVLVLLPTGSAQRASSSGAEVSASEAISAASATVGDLRGFCARQPDACTIGSQVANVIGQRAQAGAKMLYNVLSETLARRDADPASTGAARPAGSPRAVLERSAAEQHSQSTLTPADLAPSWRGPAPRKDAKHSV